MSNGQESDYTYDSIGRLSSVTHKLGDKIESLSYRYDLSGNKTEVVKHRLNETSVTGLTKRPSPCHNESAPTIGEAAALNASHFQLGETLIMGAR